MADDVSSAMVSDTVPVSAFVTLSEAFPCE